MKNSIKNHKKKDCLSIIVLILNSTMLLITLILLFCNKYGVIQLPSNIYMQCLNIFLWAIGIIAILFCKQFIPSYFILLYSIFLFFSHFLGSVLGFYALEFCYINLWWDKFLHTSFGYLVCYIAVYVLCRISKIFTLSTILVLFFIIGFSALSAVVWEIIEFASDCIFHTSAQGQHVLLPSGKYIIPVQDTMLDIILHICGTLIFVLQYILHSITKKSLIIGNLIIYFSKDK